MCVTYPEGKTISCDECPRLDTCSDDVEIDDTQAIIDAEKKAEQAFETWFHRGTGY